MAAADDVGRARVGRGCSIIDSSICVAITDLLIASLASEIGGLVWSLDHDFERMEPLGIVSRYLPPR